MENRNSQEPIVSEPVPQSRPPMQPQSPMPNPNVVPAKPPMSAMAVVALVLGAIAILTSFLPIINNFSFLLAILGIIFAVIGIAGTATGKKGGKGLAVAGLIINVLAFVVVIATQMLFSAALDSAVDSMQGARPVQSSSRALAAGDASGAAKSAASTTGGKSDFSSMPIGTTAELDNGLAITVNSVAEVHDYSGDAYSEVSVTYVNNGSSNKSFNTFDWRGEDAQGAQRSSTFIIDGDGTDDDALNSGQLAPGGTVTGVIYFEGAITKIMYISSVFADSPALTWAA